MGVARSVASSESVRGEAELVRASFDAVSECLMLVENGRILLANPACVKLFGYGQMEALLGEPVAKMFPQTRFCRDLWESSAPSPCEHPSCELPLQRPGGDEVRVQAHCTRFLYAGRGVVLIALRELSRVALGRLVRNDELRFRTIFDGAAIGIGTARLDGRIIECNAAFSKMLGYSPEELAGMHPRELHPGDFQEDEARLKELMLGVRNSYELEKRYRRKDGSYIWGHLTVSLVRDAAGEPAFVIAMVEDTTQRKRVEEQLREVEKMEVIGRLAGGVAHDFNNLLTGVLLYCDLLLNGMAPEDRMRAHVEEIRMAGEQGAALTQQLLAIGRKQVPQPRPMQVNEVLSSTENLLRRLIGEHIELIMVPGANLGPVLADQMQLRQVLLNLALNARDAMPQGGRITVRTQAKTIWQSNQQAISLSVEDTGCGMDATTRARLFEPFFTTKKPGQGNGLGLATVQRIVRDAGGTVEVESKPGRGTRIEVLLPVMKPSPKASPAANGGRAGETILLVDDHGGARNSIQRVLDDAGYRVLQASSGEQALQVFRGHEGLVDMLIADAIMPGMSGQELAHQLRQQNPKLKVLLISGYQDGPTRNEAVPAVLIRKPFAGSALIKKIREVLDSEGDLPC
jgi:two-component system, cell cycle sensor histidine kinase and response regulator CckA